MPHLSTMSDRSSEIDWAAKVAASERRQAALNALTPKQAAERALYYRKQHEQYLWRSALKRKRGYGDCSAELAAADRHAAAAVFGPMFNVAPTPVLRTTPRARERRERHIARSTSSGDSGDDGSEPPTVEPWRWADLASWRGLAADRNAVA